MEERVRAFNHRTVGQHLSSWLALVLCAAAPALATESPLSFDIAPGPLKAAISRFAAASGLQVLYDSRVVSGQRSGGAVGQLTSAQALQRILATTHIGYRMTGGAVALFRKPPPGNAVVGAVAAGQPAGVGRLKSVTVNGTRWRDGFYATGTSLSSIVVTGSLINRSNADTAEAITIVKADALKNMGISNVEQAIDQISANVPSDINVATSVSAFTGGGSYANLRDLNVGHTLVLLDGYRLADDAFTGNSVDLMGIPYSAIENIQVLRESASSLYGSDAIGGVINFVTRQSYQGAQLDLDLNRPQEAGGGSREASFSFGHGGLARDGYNLMITGSYSEQQELTASQRSFAALGLDPARGLENDNGVLGTFPGSYLDGNLNWWQVGYPSCSGNPHLTRVNGRCDYLYSAAVDLIPKTSVASGLISFIRKLWANDTLRLQYFYTRSKTTAWEGPITYAFNMVPSSPYYPSAAESTCSGGAANCSTSAPDLGGKLYVGWTDPNNDRLSAYTNTEQRILLTLSGQDRGWDYSSGLS